MKKEDSCDHGLSRSEKIDVCEKKNITEDTNPEVGAIGVSHTDSLQR